jgi:uncharacterized membrane protein YkvA (DUF1232 family)
LPQRGPALAKERIKEMEMNDFRNSSWVRGAGSDEAKKQVISGFPGWIGKVKNSDLVEKAFRLWDYLWSGKASTGDIILVVAALAYLISPIDAVPDFIPFAGWLDDVAVATLVLTYLDRKAFSQKTPTYN